MTMNVDIIRRSGNLEYRTGTHSKKCMKCGQLKDISLFYKAKKSVDGRQSYCKSCQSEANRTSQKKRSKNKKLSAAMKASWVKRRKKTGKETLSVGMTNMEWITELKGLLSRKPDTIILSTSNGNIALTLTI